MVEPLTHGICHKTRCSISAQPLRSTAKDRRRMSDQLRRPLNILVLGLALFAISVGQAREPQSAAATTVDVGLVGPRVGARLPDFTLRDQHGEPHSLKSALGPKGALIVFFRSADW
jgi:hypothetical protein